MSAQLQPQAHLVAMTIADLDEVLAIEQQAYTAPWSHGNFVDSLAAHYEARVLRGPDGALWAYFLAMRVSLTNDGRNIGLVLLDETIQGMVKFPQAYALVDVTDAACLPNVTVVNCSTRTLFPNATGDSWLWANNLQMGSGAQNRLGYLALTRAQNNPF